MAKFDYDEIMHELERVPENQESEYMEAIYESLHQMHEFTEGEISHNVDDGDIFEPSLGEAPQHYDAIEEVMIYEVVAGALDRSYGLKDFVKNIKRKKQNHDALNQELKQELADETLDLAQQINKDLNIGGEDLAESIMESTSEVTSNIVNDYEKVVESVVGPAVRKVQERSE